MIAGTLTEPIKILTATVSKNAYGEEETKYELMCNTRASILHRNGNRSQSNDEIVYTNTKTFQLRYYVPINLWDIIEWNGHKYRIIDIDPNKLSRSNIVIAELIND